jgi:hypothetical protein
MSPEDTEDLAANGFSLFRLVVLAAAGLWSRRLFCNAFRLCCLPIPYRSPKIRDEVAQCNLRGELTGMRPDA